MRGSPVVICGLALVLSSCTGTNNAPTLGAAASLRHVMPRLSEAYARTSGEQPPEITYGASGKLARQVQAGAPLDGVILNRCSFFQTSPSMKLFRGSWS